MGVFARLLRRTKAGTAEAAGTTETEEARPAGTPAEEGTETGERPAGESAADSAAEDTAEPVPAAERSAAAPEPSDDGPASGSATGSDGGPASGSATGSDGIGIPKQQSAEAAGSDAGEGART
ncbi:hypothetical protein [Streptomyces sp. enrichment culture]|uniref:hypothetical protein n=1 Tax=Streptomyces sp. enrichment culture TaxID=1795815 RepID=UPI003F563827